MILMIHQNWILPPLKLSSKEVIIERIKGRNIWGRNFIWIYFTICTSNHIFGRAIYNKLPEWNDSNFKIFNLKITRVTYPRNLPNQTYRCWLIIPNQKTLCIETNIFLSAGNYKSASGQLKSNVDYDQPCDKRRNSQKQFLKNKENLTS